MGGDDAMHPAQLSDTRLTYDDFLLFPDDGRRHELIDGAHYVTPSPNTRHQRLVLRLSVALASHVDAHPGSGEVFVAPFDVVFSHFDVVEPDLLFIAADQQDIVTEKHICGAPALVVEVLSPGTRRVDEKTKYRLFDRAGVREYWLIDPELDVVKVFRRDPSGAFPRVAELAGDTGDALTTPLLPAFSLSLASYFR